MKAISFSTISSGVTSTFDKIIGTINCVVKSILNFFSSLLKGKLSPEIKVLTPRISDLLSKVRRLSPEDAAKKYAIDKLKEIEIRKAAALKFALDKEPGRWPPNVTQIPAATKKSVGSLTADDLKGKRYVDIF